MTDRWWTRYPIAFYIVTVTAAAMALAAPSRGEEYAGYTGSASALQTQRFVYGEKHVLGLRDGVVAERAVLYTCRDGSAFARKYVSYRDPLAPDFLFEDASNGMRDGVRTEGGRRVVFFRAGRDGAEKNGALPGTPELVVDAGFDEFVRRNWPALLAGKPLTMRFLVPSRLDDVAFRVQHERSDVADGVAVDVFRLNLSGILGWVLPEIEVYYGSADHTLIRYVGLSDLRDASGDNNLKVDISFPPGDRKPADPHDFDLVRQAPLAPCK